MSDVSNIKIDNNTYVIKDEIARNTISNKIQAKDLVFVINYGESVGFTNVSMGLDLTKQQPLSVSLMYTDHLYTALQSGIMFNPIIDATHGNIALHHSANNIGNIAIVCRLTYLNV